MMLVDETVRRKGQMIRLDETVRRGAQTWRFNKVVKMNRDDRLRAAEAGSAPIRRSVPFKRFV